MRWCVWARCWSSNKTSSVSPSSYISICEHSLHSLFHCPSLVWLLSHTQYWLLRQSIQIDTGMRTTGLQFKQQKAREQFCSWQVLIFLELHSYGWADTELMHITHPPPGPTSGCITWDMFVKPDTFHGNKSMGGWVSTHGLKAIGWAATEYVLLFRPFLDDVLIISA